MIWTSEYFYGHKISDYGLKNGFVDYSTLAKAFDAVLSNDIISKTNGVVGFWESIGREDAYAELDGERLTLAEADDLIADMNEQLNSLEKESKEYSDILDKIEQLGEVYYDEIFQWYIVSAAGAEILQEANEIVYYNEDLDLYIWGVTHFGTAWDYVLTDIKIDLK